MGRGCRGVGFGGVDVGKVRRKGSVGGVRGRSFCSSVRREGGGSGARCRCDGRCAAVCVIET